MRIAPTLGNLKNGFVKVFKRKLTVKVKLPGSRDSLPDLHCVCCFFSLMVGIKDLEKKRGVVQSDRESVSVMVKENSTPRDSS